MRYGLEPGRLRHPDHRFEWTRAEFAAWAERVASAYGYGVEFRPVGEPDPDAGPPTQLALFGRMAAADPSSGSDGGNSWPDSGPRVSAIRRLWGTHKV